RRQLARRPSERRKFRRVEGFDDDVGLAQEQVEHAPAVRARDIERDPALPGVEVEPAQAAFETGPVVKKGANRAQPVAAGWLNLDDLGAHSGQELAAKMSDLSGEVEHPIAR